MVWPDNFETVQMFMDVQTQWRPLGSGVIGFDYNVVLTLASLNGAKDPVALLRDLQVMEVRARELINKEGASK